MSHYKPYPAYKDSGVQWLRRVPELWDVSPLKYLISGIESGTSVNATDTPAGGGELGVLKTSCVYSGKFDPAENKAIVPEEYGRATCPLVIGSLIVSRMNTPDLVGAAGLVCYAPDGIFLPDRLWQVSFCGMMPAFAYYWSQSGSYRTQVKMVCTGTSSSMQNLSQDQFKDFILGVPAEEEQQLIVAHLDRETARIDALIEMKTRFIALLREKRQALITHAVTKGVDPNVKMKDSRVEWLGEVPEHWDVAPMKYVCELLKDGTHLPPPRTDEGVPLLSVRNIIDGHFNLREDDSTISHQDYRELCKAFIPQEGDVLLAVVGATLGKTALIPAALGQFHIQRSLAIFRPHHARMNSCWLHLIFQSGLFQSLLWEHAGYSAQPGIYLGTLAGFSIPQPPLNEQTLIFSYLSERTARLDSLIRTTEISMELLKERRSALITAAVTGQIDLREAV